MRLPGAVIPLNPRANGSAKAMLTLGTARIVGSQSASRHDVRGSIPRRSSNFYLYHYVQTPYPIDLWRSQCTVELFVRGTTQNLLNI
jgi:hypothetical protein